MLSFKHAECHLPQNASIIRAELAQQAVLVAQQEHLGELLRLSQKIDTVENVHGHTSEEKSMTIAVKAGPCHGEDVGKRSKKTLGYVEYLFPIHTNY